MLHTPEDYKNIYYITDSLGRAELMQACSGDKVERDKWFQLLLY